jgi:hypothetical protein
MFIAVDMQTPRPLVILALRSDVGYQTSRFKTAPSRAATRNGTCSART